MLTFPCGRWNSNSACQKAFWCKSLSSKACCTCFEPRICRSIGEVTEVVQILMQDWHQAEHLLPLRVPLNKLQPHYLLKIIQPSRALKTKMCESPSSIAWVSPKIEIDSNLKSLRNVTTYSNDIFGRWNLFKEEQWHCCSYISHSCHQPPSKGLHYRCSNPCYLSRYNLLQLRSFQSPCRSLGGQALLYKGRDDGNKHTDGESIEPQISIDCSKVNVSSHLCWLQR